MLLKIVCQYAASQQPPRRTRAGTCCWNTFDKRTRPGKCAHIYTYMHTYVCAYMLASVTATPKQMSLKTDRVAAMQKSYSVVALIYLFLFCFVVVLLLSVLCLLLIAVTRMFLLLPLVCFLLLLIQKATIVAYWFCCCCSPYHQQVVGLHKLFCDLVMNYWRKNCAQSVLLNARNYTCAQI